jgi:hypothetical protein
MTGGVVTRRSGRFACVLAALCLFSIAGAPKAESHESSTSYLKVDTRDDGTLNGSLDVGVLDLSWSVPLDADGDGRVLWGEVEAAQPDIAALVAGKLLIERGAGKCTLHVADVLVTRHVGEPYLSIPFVARCRATGLLRIRSDLFFSEDAGHRTLFDVRGFPGRKCARMAAISGSQSMGDVCGVRRAGDLARMDGIRPSCVSSFAPLAVRARCRERCLAPGRRPQSRAARSAANR